MVNGLTAMETGQLRSRNRPDKSKTGPRAPAVARRFFRWVVAAGLGVMVLSRVVLAQAPVTAELDRTAISTDEQVTLTVTVAGNLLDIPVPNLSALTDFRVVGSSQSTQVSIINGRLSSQGRFVYRLQPLKEGMLTIPPVSIELDGQTYQTDPLTVEVVAGSSPAAPPGEDLPQAEPPDNLQRQLFVEAEVDNPAPYLGQQITYTFRLYQATNFIGQPDYRPPAFTNFWGQNILSQPQYNTTVNGRNYLVTEIRTALFPAGIGKITIDPARLVVPGGFFEPDIVLESEPLTINVRPLPEGAPVDFTGAVGRFQILAHFDTTQGRVNEPVTLVVEIKGTGNIDVLTEPPLPELPQWRVFESQSSTLMDVQDDVVGGTRRFERLMVPRQPGRLEIPPIRFSYYNPADERYHTVQTGPLSLEVRPGEVGDAAIPGRNPDDATMPVVSGDIRHIKPVPTTLRPARALVLGRPVYWLCWLAPALVVAAVWGWHRRQQRLAADSAYARRVTARRTAHRILAQAGRSGADPYALAHRALLGYLADKLNRPTIGLTTGELIHLLNQARLDPALVERVKTTLEQIDIGRFAPVEQAAAHSLVVDTRRLIDDLEKMFGA